MEIKRTASYRIPDQSLQASPSRQWNPYLSNANPEKDKVIARIVPAGGKVILPKTKNPAGYVCIFKDTEGNKMGLSHATNKYSNYEHKNRCLFRQPP